MPLTMRSHAAKPEVNASTLITGQNENVRGATVT